LQDTTASEQNDDDDDEVEEDVPDDENSDVDLDSQKNKDGSNHEGSVSDVF
jgi:hypothetical protein